MKIKFAKEDHPIIYLLPEIELWCTQKQPKLYIGWLKWMIVIDFN